MLIYVRQYYIQLPILETALFHLTLPQTFSGAMWTETYNSLLLLQQAQQSPAR